jgi:hypothetical protein
VEADPSLDLRLIKIANTLADGGAAHLLVNNWPQGTSTDQARELLQQYGAIRSCALRSDDSCYCEYVDPHITDVALAQMDGMQYGGRVLVARKVAPNAEAATALQQLMDQQQAKLAQKQFSALGLKMPVMPQHAQLVAQQAAHAKQQAQAAQQAQQAAQQAEEKRNSCVVKLGCMVERDELLEQEDYEEILADTSEEVAKYGKLRKVVIPQPSQDQGEPPGWLVGWVVGWAGVGERVVLVCAACWSLMGCSEADEWVLCALPAAARAACMLYLGVPCALAIQQCADLAMAQPPAAQLPSHCTDPLLPLPVPIPAASDPPGVGYVFLEYEDWKSAERAHKALNGRRFGDNTVVAEFLDEQVWADMKM